MADSGTQDTRSIPVQDPFANTRWTLIRQAGGENSALALKALDELCRLYWYPVYGYIRKRGAQHCDAEDLTQQFLSGFLEGDLCSRISPEYGRFRGLLMVSVKNFLNKDYQRSQRLKRGGGHVHFPIDWLAAREKYAAEAADHLTPDVYFDRALATSLLERVMERLAEEHLQPAISTRQKAAEKRQRQFKEFELLKSHLIWGENDVPYAAIASDLGITTGNARVKVNRLRARFRELLRHELSRICDPEYFDDEWRALLQALAR